MVVDFPSSNDAARSMARFDGFAALEPHFETTVAAIQVRAGGEAI